MRRSAVDTDDDLRSGVADQGARNRHDRHSILHARGRSRPRDAGRDAGAGVDRRGSPRCHGSRSARAQLRPAGYRKYFHGYRGRADYEAPSLRSHWNTRRGRSPVYSDLGFILLGFILEAFARRTLDAVRRLAAACGFDEPLDFRAASRIGAHARRRPSTTVARPGLQGEVHDENAAALGGVAAHAGLFGTAQPSASGALVARLLRGRDDATWRATAGLAASPAARPCRAARARLAGTRCCRLRPAARGCPRRRSVTPDLPARHCGWIRSTTSISSCSPIACIPTRTNDAIQAVRRAFHDAASDQSDIPPVARSSGDRAADRVTLDQNSRR